MEDTTCDYEDVESACGSEVAELVAALSKDTRIPETIREKAYHEQLAAANWKVMAIKLADVYDNLCDAVETQHGVNTWQRAFDALTIARGHKELAHACEQLDTLMATVADKRHLLDKALATRKHPGT